MTRGIEDELGPVVTRHGGGPPGWPQALDRFLERLRARNRQVNLVSRRSVDEALQRHVLPSLAALLVIPPERELRVLDVGSGGGFPGIPLKILRPRIRLDLVEATRKKCDFLADCARELGLEATRVHWCRIEDPSPEVAAAAPFDTVLARGVGAQPLIERSCRPLLAAGGRIWVFVSASEASPNLVWSNREGAPVTGLRAL